MNDNDRQELEQLKQRQEVLQHQLDQLDVRIRTLAEHLEPLKQDLSPLEFVPLDVQPTGAGEPDAKPGVQSPPAVSVPPILPAAALDNPASTATQTSSPGTFASSEAPKPAQPPPIPPVIPSVSTEAPKSSVPPVTEPPPVFIAAAGALPQAEASEHRESFEVRLGSYWAVRIGAVVLLTGLAFAANYAYENYVANFGPGGKITLLYLASALLLGIGGWLQRKHQKESVRNYAQVVFAAGLAAVYFTTYAAHHIEPVKVIGSALVDGVLLLGWAGFIVWLADRRKSEVMALFATGLAYYTSIVTSIGTFTLYSNLILTVASVFFLVRNRWTTLSFASLVATYAGFAFWRFYSGMEAPRMAHELWRGNFFLAGYWIVFSTAVFLSRADKMVHATRATFASFNNAAFFGLVVMSMYNIDRGNFWKFSLCLGIALLMLFTLARRILPSETSVQNSYLTQGVLLVTVGFIARFTGLQLALILAAQSTALIVLGYQQKNRVMRIASALSATLAAAWEIYAIVSHPFGTAALPVNTAVFLGAAVGALLFFNSLWSSRHEPRQSPETFRLQSGGFAVLSLLVWLITTWHFVPADWLAPVLAIEAVTVTALSYSRRMTEALLLAQGYLILAQLSCAMRAVEVHTPPWWNPVTVIVVTQALSHWWQRQKVLEEQPGMRKGVQAFYALAVVGLLYFWLGNKFRADHWLAVTSVLAVATTIYGLATRSWFLAGSAQLLLAASAWEFGRQLVEGHPAWWLALAPVAALLLLASGVTAWLGGKKLEESETTQVHDGVLMTSTIYRWAATGMTLWWIIEYIPVRERTWIFALIGIATFCVAALKEFKTAFVHSAVFFAAAFVQFVALPEDQAVYWPNLAAILALPVLQQLAKRMPERFRVQPEFHGPMVVPATLCLWVFISRWVQPHDLWTAFVWAVFAMVLVGAASALGEKPYRWIGFAALAAALGHVVFLDLWRANFFWPNVLPVLAVLFLHYLARKYPEQYELQATPLNVMVLAGGLSLWVFVSRWVILESGGRHFFLTAIWALLAFVVFATGLIVRERLYRWLGLAILGCAVGRVFLSDVWHLQAIYRILSFMALGIVLLLVGFFYSKYQDKIKEWI